MLTLAHPITELRAWRRMVFTPKPVERPAEDVRRRWPRGRKLVLVALGRIGSIPLLRLCLGRWPDATERRCFVKGMVAGASVVPPLLRGLHAVPSAKEQVGKLALLNLVREGAISRPAGQVSLVDGNPLSAWRGPALSVLHFEKAAGTALVAAMAVNFHPWQIDHDRERGTAPHVLSAFSPNIAGVINYKYLVWGHYDLPALRRLGPERTIITLLRRPSDRVLSLYYFWRSIQPHLITARLAHFNVAAAHDHDLLSFLRCRDPLISNYIDNVYVRRLTGTYGDAELGNVLQDATRALASCEVVGTVEHVSGCLSQLRALGLDLPSHLPRRNTAEGSHVAAPSIFRLVARERITPEIKAELERLTRYDEIIYRQACARGMVTPDDQA